jgi:class 3 adenylate cyclase
MAACGSCGTGLRESAKFCDECGAPTAVSGDTAEYKQVTVLFADVVRSMDIAAAVDIERLREIMTEVVERSAAVVRRYGGTVEYNGDGVIALFGAPVALEDHAFRACLAALTIQEEASRLATEVQRRDGVHLGATAVSTPFTDPGPALRSCGSKQTFRDLSVARIDERSRSSRLLNWAGAETRNYPTL